MSELFRYLITCHFLEERGENDYSKFVPLWWGEGQGKRERGGRMWAMWLQNSKGHGLKMVVADEGKDN